MSDDITHDLDLLDDWLAGKGYGEEAGLVLRALSLIHKQAEENEKLRAYLGPNAVTYRVPGVTVIKIYDNAQSAAEAVRFGHETSYVSAALKDTGDETL